MFLCVCRYYKAARLAEVLQPGEHYTVDEKQKSVLMTEDGYEAAEDVLEVQILPALHYICILVVLPALGFSRSAETDHCCTEVSHSFVAMCCNC